MSILQRKMKKNPINIINYWLKYTGQFWVFPDKIWHHGRTYFYKPRLSQHWLFFSVHMNASIKKGRWLVHARWWGCVLTHSVSHRRVRAHQTRCRTKFMRSTPVMQWSYKNRYMRLKTGRKRRMTCNNIWWFVSSSVVNQPFLCLILLIILKSRKESQHLFRKEN